MTDDTCQITNKRSYMTDATCQITNTSSYITNITRYITDATCQITNKRSCMTNKRSYITDATCKITNKRSYMIYSPCQIVNKLSCLMTSTCLITERTTCMTLCQRSNEITYISVSFIKRYYLELLNKKYYFVKSRNCQNTRFLEINIWSNSCSKIESMKQVLKHFETADVKILISIRI